jgi:2-polyprenyl-6-methoxyphenol hydroxylase-like FAD-dependent oxidoreductase
VRPLTQAGQVVIVGAGILLWPSAMRVLHRLEVGAAIEHAGAVATHGSLRSWRGALLSSGLVDGLAAGSGAPLAVHRGLLQSILRPALDKGVPRLGAECVGVVQDEAGATVRLADGGSEQGDLVVGADGLNSLVRASMVDERTIDYHLRQIFTKLGISSRAELILLRTCRRVPTPSRCGALDAPIAVSRACSAVACGKQASYVQNRAARVIL